MSEFRKWINCILIVAGLLAIIVGVTSLAMTFPTVFLGLAFLAVIAIAIFSLHNLLYGDN